MTSQRQDMVSPKEQTKQPEIAIALRSARTDSTTATPVPPAPQANDFVRLTQPRTTARPLAAHFSGCLIDLALLSFSACFMAWGFVVYALNGNKVQNHPQLVSHLIETTKYAPTIFPILFTTVIGRATRACLSWRIERGERLGFLDLLANCTSVVNSLLAQVSLRTLSVGGFCIALLWTLSPIGGQSTLRLLSIGDAQISNPTPIAYLAAKNTYAAWYYDVSKRITIASALYTAALVTPVEVKHSPRDAWSNLKIPRIENLENENTTAQSGAWIDVPNTNVSYSALVGLPMTSPPSDTNSTFNLETAYWSVSCPILRRGTPLFKPSLWNANSSWVGSPPYHAVGFLLSSNTSRPNITGPATEFVSNYQCDRNSDQSNVPPRLFAFDDPWSTAFCYISTTYVEANVQCTGTTCLVDRVRRSQQPHPPSGWTYLDGEGCLVWTYFATNFILAIVPGVSGALPTVSQGYLYNPDAPTAHSGISELPIWKLDNEVFSERFAQLLNTFWLVCISWTAITDVSAVRARWLSDHANHKSNLLFGGDPVELANRTLTTAQTQKVVQIVQCHKGWLIALLLASGVLVLASVIPTAVRFFARAPRFELNVSTLVRDNPFVDAPTGGSALDSARRSRLMKDIKVKLGDVAPDRNIGHLAVASVGETRFVDTIKRDRLYD